MPELEEESSTKLEFSPPPPEELPGVVPEVTAPEESPSVPDETVDANEPDDSPADEFVSFEFWEELCKVEPVEPVESVGGPESSEEENTLDSNALEDNSSETSELVGGSDVTETVPPS